MPVVCPGDTQPGDAVLLPGKPTRKGCFLLRSPDAKGLHKIIFFTYVFNSLYNLVLFIVRDGKGDFLRLFFSVLVLLCKSVQCLTIGITTHSNDTLKYITEILVSEFREKRGRKIAFLICFRSRFTQTDHSI